MENDREVIFGYGAQFGNVFVEFDTFPPRYGWEVVEFEDGSCIHIRPHGEIYAYGSKYNDYKSSLYEVVEKEGNVRVFLVNEEKWI